MTLKFSKSVSGLFLYQALYNRVNTNAYAAFAIYKGERPTSSEIIDNWSKYNRTAGSELLWNGAVTCAFDVVNNEFYATGMYVAVAPYQAGTASWGIMLTYGSSNAASAPFTSPTIGPTYQSFVVFDVSDTLGTAPMKLETLELNPANGVLGTVDFTIKAIT